MLKTTTNTQQLFYFNPTPNPHFVEAGSSVSIVTKLQEVSIRSGSGDFLPHQREQARRGYHMILRRSIEGAWRCRKKPELETKDKKR
jgi:hypothetical protein